ncbi:MAG: hypothetical protein LBU62_07140 [Bacteroidales bacterium]|jgi:hypothetical protein|nr:hypothetical protein [Bacteroidales bacterium]
MKDKNAEQEVANRIKLYAQILEEKKSAKKKKANKDMIAGALWCIGGTIVTVMTYSAASSGGRYMVAWGAIIFGAIQFIKGAVSR